MVYQRAAAYALSDNIGVHPSPSFVQVEEQHPAGSIDDSTLSVEHRASTPTRDHFLVPQNRRFYGREEILAAVRKTLHPQEHSTGISMCTLYGLGGVGKTEIALEYARSCSEESVGYAIVWYIDAQSPTSIAISYSSIVRRLGLTTSTEPSVHVGIIMECLRRMGKSTAQQSWLLVFDNFDPDSTNGHGSVLITSRRPPENPKTAIQVAPFATDEGAHFFLSLLDRSDSAEGEMTSAVALAKALGSLPLALESAASYINTTQTSVTIYLEKFKMLSQRPPSGVTPGPVYRSIPLLDEVFAPAVAGLSSQATTLLQLLAFLDPDGLDERLLLTEAVTPNDAIGASDSQSL
ncbi:P-loop containing nucleoside triphosphate hydrolase protein [Staphylotrichum tortipilum]|uniref:P-loop containing nucleoside triphosphate hydrolase protein n=1 Tax=Staphylotrichum tortipilum TaxID=2831512 RepID=A0AAN6MK15_9PEZI|nr:P-loop containing nucleoside triphosphate hydrolase protein [Staphylotrichum longicolle]